MNFFELKKEVKTLGLDTLRFDYNDYFEVVIVKNDLEKLNPILEKALGLPVWPSKTTLSEEIGNAVVSFGGIRGDQTLHFRRDVYGILFAMLWPWSDGEHVTLKIVNK